MFRAVIRRVLVALHVVKRPGFVSVFCSTQPSADALRDGVVMIVRQEGHEKWACFRCPGGCGEKIMLSLAVKRRPRWSAVRDWLARTTIEPSIWQQNDCGCHFWIRGGDVTWCDGGRPMAAGLDRDGFRGDRDK